MRAYSGSPWARSWLSNVPMHPRRDASSCSHLFHVTKRGAAVGGRGSDDVEVEGVSSASEVDEVDDEEEEPASTARRRKVGSRRPFTGAKEAEVEDAEEAWISSRLMGLRRLRWASRASKQMRQCSVVAMESNQAVKAVRIW